MSEDWDRGMGDEPEVTTNCIHGCPMDGYCWPRDMDNALEGPYVASETWHQCEQYRFMASEVADLRLQNTRMLVAFDRIHRIAGDLLDPERRAGPTGKVRTMPEVGKSAPDDVEKGHPKVLMDLSGL